MWLNLFIENFQNIFIIKNKQEIYWIDMVLLMKIDKIGFDENSQF